MFSQSKASGSVKVPISPPMTIRCDPVPSGGTPASFAAARRPYNANLMFAVANSTYLRPKLFATDRPRST
ncbi:hypothetical protein STSO111631_14235 [Stackebrandtia soli]